MSKRVTLKIGMELLSDVIFDAGVGVPGGEHVAVVRDADGYPYLKSTTLKGLLRESVRTASAWNGLTEGGEAETLDALFGRRGRSADPHRGLRFTSLRLEDPPEDPGVCFSGRAFTALEDGHGKSGGLRTTMTICRGLLFTGTIYCGAEDVPLLRDAAAAIKWVGGLTCQGMGYVRLWAEELQGVPVIPAESLPADCRCIRYVLHTETPVQIRNLRESGYQYRETRPLIPGSAIRGAVIERLSEEEPAWFAENRSLILSDAVRFLDAVPNPCRLPAIPVLQGFYEDKGESCLEKVVVDGGVSPGLKRAALGEFCALEGTSLRYWSALRGDMLRSEKSYAFFTRYLSPGQDLEGYILLDETAPAQALAAALQQELWVGADRSAGFGLCSVKELTAVEAPAWAEAYGYGTQDTPGEHLYLAALSPLTMLNAWGEPCGINLETLAEKLGVQSVEILHCSTGVEESSGYHRLRGCGLPRLRMYRAGSLFHLKCDGAPSAERLRALQQEGLGLRRAEGCGQVLFLRPELYEALQTKRELPRDPSGDRKHAAALRRAKYTWAMDNAPRIVAVHLRPKELYRLRDQCERSLALNDGGEGIRTYLTVQMEQSGRSRVYREVDGLFVRDVLDKPLEQILGIPCQDDSRIKLEVLLLLLSIIGREGAE